VILAATTVLRAQVAPPAALRIDEVVAGSAEDFMEVRHVVLAGSNFEIGRALAKLAAEHLGAKVERASDPGRARPQRLFVERNFPAMAERMRGAAAFWGVAYESDEFDLSSIADPAARPACSVVYYPPKTTADGVGILSRNYDFSTGTLFGRRPPAGARPCTARPLVLELYPDGGAASLSLCAYDAFAGVIDGVNSHGLAVALLAVDEQNESRAVEDRGPMQVGFGCLTMLRLLLDTCRDVEEAKQALLTIKQTYLIPTHLIVCDRSGKSFIWERSFGGNFDYVFDGDGKPQIITNYAIHRHPDLATLPLEQYPLGACRRARTLADGIAAHAGPLSVDDIKQLNGSVACTPEIQPLSHDRGVGRTLWHALYMPEERRLSVDFYLGDVASPKQGQPSQRRSGYLDFELSEMTAAAKK
jgi:hypothetical protein